MKPEPEGLSRPAANGQVLVPAVHAGHHAERRRRLARKIVQRHETYAAVGGLFPLPVVNVAGVAAIIMRTWWRQLQASSMAGRSSVSGRAPPSSDWWGARYPLVSAQRRLRRSLLPFPEARSLDLRSPHSPLAP